MSCARQVAGVVGLALLCSACAGGGDDDDDETVVSGTVTEPWRDFCVGTFTRDYQVVDAFDEPQFRARAGEEYLLSEYGDSFGPSAQMVYLWPGGPEEFEVTAATTADFPFTTACPLNTATSYYAVFENVSVYAEETLSTKLCDLSAGTALPLDRGDSVGYALVTFELFGPNTYEVFLNVFSAQCGGAVSGFVSVPPVESFDSTTWLVPIIAILHP